MRSVLLGRQAKPSIPFYFTSEVSTEPILDPQSITELAIDQKAGLIIIDSPGNFDIYADTRGSHSQYRLLASLLQLACTANAAVLVVMHTRKRRSPFASSLVAAGAAHVLYVESPFDSSTVFIRTLASAGPDPISITAQTRIGREFFRMSPASIKPASLLGPAGYELLRYLAKLQRADTRELMASLASAVPTRVRTLIHELVRDGYIHCVQRGSPRRPAVYALTPAGKSLL